MSGWTTMRWHTARVVHYCSLCYRKVDSGEMYGSQRGFDYSRAWTFKTCMHCEMVNRIWHPENMDGGIDCDAYEAWATSGEQENVAEARAMAGFRNKWRTRSGALWPLPSKEQETL